MERMIQLTFIEESREERLEREVNALKEQIEKIRKGQYAKIGKLSKMYQEIKQEHEDFKASICQGKYNLQ
jgi:hypothetical protein